MLYKSVINVMLLICYIYIRYTEKVTRFFKNLGLHDYLWFDAMLSKRVVILEPRWVRVQNITPSQGTTGTKKGNRQYRAVEFPINFFKNISQRILCSLTYESCIDRLHYTELYSLQMSITFGHVVELSLRNDFSQILMP